MFSLVLPGVAYTATTEAEAVGTTVAEATYPESVNRPDKTSSNALLPDAVASDAVIPASSADDSSSSITGFGGGSAGGALPAPKYVYAKGITSSEIRVNWRTVGGAEGYYIYRSDTENGTYVKIGETIGAQSTSFLDRDRYYPTSEIEAIGAYTEYYYKVSSYNSSGESPLSDVVSHTYTNKDGQVVTEVLSKGTTIAADPPLGVVVLDNNDMTVTVKWQKSEEPNLTGYNIYRSDSSGGTFVKLNDTPVTELEYVDNVTISKDYYYKVAVLDENNREGIPSAEVWIRPEAQPGQKLPHVKYQQDAKECGYCHNTHASSGQNLLAKVSEAEVCFVCHDGTGSKTSTYQEFTGNYPSKHSLGENGLSCASCHDSHLDAKAINDSGNRLYPAIMRGVSVDGNTNYKGNEQCYKCHGVGSELKGGNHKSAFEDSVHNLGISGPGSGTEITCSACHQPHVGPNENLKVYKEENSCLACHSSNAVGGTVTDIYTKIMTDNTNSHDLLASDREKSDSQLQCVNCHNPHGITPESKVINPDNPAPGSRWTGNQTDFCLKCHDGTLPREAETLPYAPGISSGQKTLTNILEMYYLGSDQVADAHGEGDGEPQSLDISMGYDNSSEAPNYVMDCSVCHEPHGTPNNSNLRTVIKSVDATKTKEGLLTYQWEYQNSNGETVRGVDARFFCKSCHTSSNHVESQNFPRDCFSCHKHGSKF